MINRHLSEEEIAVCAEAANREELTSLAEELKRHLQECDECAHYVLEVSEVVYDLAENNPVDARSKYVAAGRALLAAASIALIVGIAYILYPIDSLDYQSISQQQKRDAGGVKKLLPVNNDQVDVGTQASEGEHNQHVNKGNGFLQSDECRFAYVPDKKLEKLCRRFIGSAMRGTEVLVLSPALMECNSTLIELKWNKNTTAPLIIELYDNAGVLISENQTTNSSFKPKNLTTPGLYYWKLLNEDFDLLFCGKIYIR